MNEQEMFIKQKIEKREKIDAILAYVLIVILLGCILLVLYLKFIRKEADTNLEEYVPNYISLSEISSSLNTSTLANRYMNDAASFNSSVSGDALVVSYIKNDVNVTLNIPVVGNELAITIDENNSDIVTDIYKEIANIICMFYGNQELYCRNTLDNMGENSIDGIRFVNTGDTNTVYITTTRSYSISDEVVYNSVTDVGINDTNYVLNILDIKISNINVVTSDSSIKFSGNVERLTSDKKDISIIIKLYDIDGNVLGENKYEYTDENVLNSTGTFETQFLLTDELTFDKVNKYSIDIVK